ncbi:unnamed protein product [Leptidea sinapis]|uniref:Doublecortin domain-containing protein n=1 Tax=Leptidea sinapis TaxID=189913 RepID=A0A5E4Q277_9NEOP|nr:unnamed protein product [Leptidea sinapis]
MENNLSRSGSRSSSVCELEKELSDMEIIKSRTNRRSIFARTLPARKAKRIRFYRNGDKFYSGVIIPVLPERYRSFDSLTTDLTRVLLDNVTLPNGVSKLDDLEDGQSYVCSGFGEPFKKIDYEASAVTPQSFRLSGPEQMATVQLAMVHQELVPQGIMWCDLALLLLSEMVLNRERYADCY